MASLVVIAKKLDVQDNNVEETAETYSLTCSVTNPMVYLFINRSRNIQLI
jgi:hypothetical protein